MEYERGGIVFREAPSDGSEAQKWVVLDIGYNVIVGNLAVSPGPGWVLTQIGTSFLDPFLDLGQMQTIIDFTKDVDAGTHKIKVGSNGG